MGRLALQTHYFGGISIHKLNGMSLGLLEFGTMSHMRSYAFLQLSAHFGVLINQIGLQRGIRSLLALHWLQPIDAHRPCSQRFCLIQR